MAKRIIRPRAKTGDEPPPPSQEKPAGKRKGKAAPVVVVGPPQVGPIPRTARLTVVEQLSYEQQNGKHPQVRSAYSRSIGSDEEVYQRSLPVTPAWAPVDTGWVSSPGMIHLVNEEGKNLTVIPTREERAAIDSRIIEVKVDGADDSHVFLLWPGESMRVYPGPGLKLVARCPAGPARCALSIFPG